MAAEFVIGIDSSTQSTKAIAWSRSGDAIGEGRAPIAMSTPAEGLFEQDPHSWWQATCAALIELGGSVDLSLARALAISNQRETVGFLAKNGEPIRPAMVWLDERAKDEVDRFSRRFGAEKLHRSTGKPVDIIPVVYRLAWMQRNEPDILADVDQIVDVHGYLVGKLTGHKLTSWTSADPMGTFDITAKRWNGEILNALGMTEDQFTPVVMPGTNVGHVSNLAASATGLPAGLPVFAAGGDGQCAGLGVNAMRSGSAYLNLGTAIITGAWASDPRIGFDWRTMVSPTGAGYFLEGVQRAGTFFVDWYVKTFIDADANEETFPALEAQAEKISVGSNGVLICPYLSGCMNPLWEMAARATFFGLGPNHNTGHVYRAVLEALTGEITRSIQSMKEQGVEIDRILAVGGGANSMLWRKMIADASGLPLTVSTSLEASSLGAAMTAARGLGWYADFDSAAEEMSGTAGTQRPDPSEREAWQTLLRRQNRLNQLTCEEADLCKPI